MIDQHDHDRADRRETMLEGLIAVMTRHHRRRRIRRRVGAAGAIVLVAAGGAWIVRAQQPGPPDQIVVTPASVVTVVGDDYRTGLVRVIDDDELVERLTDIERPAGLIPSEGRIWLTGAVIDGERGSADETDSTL
jgi:hypothetical protein